VLDQVFRHNSIGAVGWVLCPTMLFGLVISLEALIFIPFGFWLGFIGSLLRPWAN
jgi:hypothetical protein